jgi:uncharacterized protein (DUF1330 family)
MGIVQPTKEQMKAFAEMPDEGPIFMINLLKFKADGGRESYQTYGQKFAEIMMSKGVEIIYHGNAKLTVIGTEDWDEVIVVKYPSRDSFIEMTTNPEYQAASKFRTAGIEDSRLILTKIA